MWKNIQFIENPLVITLIKILVDNTAYKKFFAQHGFSALIESKGKRILFDAGQHPKIIEENLKLFDEKEGFDYVVLSHGHYDHCDGLKYIIDNELINGKVIVHKDAFLEKYAGKRYIGMSDEVKKYLLKKADLEMIIKPYKIDKNIIVSGEVPRDFPYEMEKFMCIKNGKLVEDELKDDMFLIANGILITGCSHSGIINVVEYGKKLSEIEGVLGGFHLGGVSEPYLNNVVNYFKSQPFWIMPMHCTGFKASVKLSQLKNFVYGHVGKVI
ncbi:MAG: MBL fold metallo-hydrolase [Methanococci archaeon]|nr:MBL fold metallo-hydrolase [Methanococci archaeon]